MSNRAEKHSGPFPTSEEVLQRIHWDPRLHIEDFVVAYDERFKGRCEIRATEFPLHGEIPWHRVWQVRLGRMVIWDRERREHRLAQLHQIQKEHQTRREQRRIEPQSNNTPTPRSALALHKAHVYDSTSGQWRQQPETSPPGRLAGTLRICTYNVLFDLYEKEKVCASQRMPALHRLLQESNADVIGLQEITHDWLQELLKCPWLQQEYFVSAHQGCDSIEPYGQVLLSRFPIQQLVTLAHSPHKRTLLAILKTSPTPLGIAVVHLTSDHRTDASERRQKQVEHICALMTGQHPDLKEHQELSFPADFPWIMLGDFNTRGDETQALLDAHDFTDVWTWLHPNQPGYTFAPADNALAAFCSQSQRPGRLDRIMLRDAHTPIQMLPTHAQIIGQTPIAHTAALGPLHPSDHFGLLCTLQVSAL